jgi:acyl-coenzyme A thioesterase PaaI-like protein
LGFVDFKALVLANHRTRQAAQSSEGGYVFTVLRTTVALCAHARLRDIWARRPHSYVTIHDSIDSTPTAGDLFLVQEIMDS